MAQLKNSRYPALLSIFLNIVIYILLFWTGEGGVQKSYPKFVIVVSNCSNQICIKKVIGGWTMRQIDIDSQSD